MHEPRPILLTKDKTKKKEISKRNKEDVLRIEPFLALSQGIFSPYCRHELGSLQRLKGECDGITEWRKVIAKTYAKAESA